MKRTHIFDNWQDIQEISDNVHPLVPKRQVENIVRGTSIEHFIFIPFHPVKDMLDCIITYKQGYDIILTKHYEDIEKFSQTDEGRYCIYYSLTQEETNLFKPIKNEKVLVQMKSKLANNEVVESNIYELNVLDSLTDEVIL